MLRHTCTRICSESWCTRLIWIQLSKPVIALKCACVLAGANAKQCVKEHVKSSQYSMSECARYLCGTWVSTYRPSSDNFTPLALYLQAATGVCTRAKERYSYSM